MSEQAIPEGTQVTLEAWVVVRKGAGDSWKATVLINDTDPPISILDEDGEKVDDSVAVTAVVVTDSFMRNEYELF